MQLLSKAGDVPDDLPGLFPSSLLQVAEPRGGSWLWQPDPLAPLTALGSSGFPPELPASAGTRAGPGGASMGWQLSP